MRMIVVAKGVDDCRTPIYGHHLPAIKSLGHQVWTFDPHASEAQRSQDEQWRWALETFQPQLVVFCDLQSAYSGPLDGLADELGIPSIHLALPAKVFPQLDDQNRGSFHRHLPSLAIIRTDCDPQSLEATQLFTTSLTSHSSMPNQSVRLFGQDWLEQPRLSAITHGPVVYGHLPQTLSKSRFAVIHCASLGSISAQQAALDAALSKTSIVAVRGIDVEDVLDEGQVFFVDNVASCAELVDNRVSVAPDETRIAAAYRHVIANHSAIDYWGQMLSAHDHSRNGSHTATEKSSESVQVKKSGPKVSFVTAAYNIERYVGPMLESCLNQSEQDIEVVITNDGSTDATASVIDKYAGDRRVRVIDQPNIGHTKRIDWVFQRSTQEARGDFIAVIGGDDISMPDRIERQLAVFNDDPEVDLVHTGGCRIDANGNVHNKMFILDYSYNAATALRRQLFSNVIASPTVMIRRSSFERFGRWHGGFTHDYSLHTEVMAAGRARYLPHQAVGYRVHESNISTGANAAEGVAQGVACRDRDALRYTLADLYPGLQHPQDNDELVWAAALLDFGNVHLTQLPSPTRARHFYDLARNASAELANHLALNTAISYILEGNRNAAIDALGPLGLADQIDQLTVADAVRAESLTKAPTFLPPEVLAQTPCWDGTPASQMRLLVVCDWSNCEPVTQAISAYFECFKQSDGVDLVFATLGNKPSSAVASLTGAIPPGYDLETCPEITLEEWDDLDFVPADRFAAIFQLQHVTGNVRNEIKREMLRVRNSPLIG